MSRSCRHLIAVLAIAASALAGCGSSSKSSSSASSQPSPAQQGSTLPPALNELPQAERPSASQFPPAGGRTLRQLSTLASTSAQLGPATGTFTPGTRRLAFALNASSGAFIYGPTAIYVSKGPNAPASGPYLAPADPLTVAPQFRSKQNSGPGGVQAIYAAQVPLPRAGTYTILSLTRGPSGFIGAPGEIAVASSSPIPDTGQRPPAVATDTQGSPASLTTRQPPENMHSVSLNQVLGKQPVALLFSTPQFCTSRICGPVTDILVSLQQQFAGKIAFIHQEVYVNNQPSQGLRPQLKAFHLQTEPWLFTINRRGVIVRRLEGAFGVNAVSDALRAALR